MRLVFENWVEFEIGRFFGDAFTASAGIRIKVPEGVSDASARYALALLEALVANELRVRELGGFRNPQTPFEAARYRPRPGSAPSPRLHLNGAILLLWPGEAKATERALIETLCREATEGAPR